MLTTNSALRVSRDTVRTDVNAYLEKYFDEKTVSASLMSSHYELLWKTISDFALAGGKRLRPYMTILAYRAYGGGSESSILPIAAAQELLHLSMLIHDDIIDRDFKRYGVKNIHGTYMDIYKSRIAESAERVHFANSAALMAGDLLLSGSYELCAKSELPSKDSLLSQAYLASAIFSVVGGELLDTESPFQPVSAVDTHTIAVLKTASYSFNAPLLTGAALAGADSAELEKLATFAEGLGVAYQFTDDLLGVFGNDELTGKSNTSDLSEGKRTLLLQKTYELSSKQQRAVLDTLIGKADLTEDEANAVREIIEASGARKEVEATIASFSDKALTHLDMLTIDDAFREQLRDLVSLSTKRQS